MFEWLAPSAQSACHAKQSIAAQCNQPDNCSCYFTVCDLYNQAYKALALHQPRWRPLGTATALASLRHSLFQLPSYALGLHQVARGDSSAMSLILCRLNHATQCHAPIAPLSAWIGSAQASCCHCSCHACRITVSASTAGAVPPWGGPNAGCGSAGCSSQVRWQTQSQPQPGCD